MDLLLYDDEVARGWRPFALTRPIGELMFGAYTLRARAARATGGEAVGHITSSVLAGFDEPGAPPVVEADLGAGDRNRLFLSSRVVAGAPLPALPHETPALLQVEGQWAGLWVPSGTPVPQGLL
ncbi:MAG: hypothetical protein HKO53_18570, partial [Gemmatimonadetes bacterium]|nr:hypothetical protein [Gemmatimonadota bacterium]